MLKELKFETREGAYLVVLSVGVLVDRFINHLFGGDPLLFGQPGSVLATYAYVAAAFALWLLDNSRKSAQGWLRLFLLALGVTWILHFLLYRLHGDAFNYTAMLYLPVLLMIGLKPPNQRSSKRAVLAIAWSITAVLFFTLVAETVGFLDPRPQLPGIVAFDEAAYFLPLNDALGIDGRWPGPFGHNGDTAMMGALLIVMALAFWSRASWVFLSIGALTLVLTNGRASIGAAIVGLVIVFMFTPYSRLDGLSRRLRIVSGLVVLTLGGLFMLFRPAGVTGRDKIWPAFLKLWEESPWVGVGGSGFVNGNEITRQFGHAHSLYVEELARSGLVGFISLAVALGIGTVIAAQAAGLSYPGPLAVMATYFVTAITEPRNNWIEPSATGFLLILMVLAASARVREEEISRHHARSPTVGE